MASVKYPGLLPYCSSYTESQLSHLRSIVPLEDSVKMWWRVKTWEITYIVGDDQKTTISSVNAASESDLVCLSPSFFIEHPVEGFEIFSGNISFGYYVDCNVNISSASVVLISTASTVISPENGYIRGELTLDVFGNIYDGIKLRESKSLFPFGGSQDYSGFTINAKATEYWEYDPNDGKGPKYNKTTGEQLRFDI